MRCTLLDSPIGRLGLAWGAADPDDAKVWSVQLPGASDGATITHLLRHAPATREGGRAVADSVVVQPDDPALPEPVRRAVAGLQALLAGERDPLTWIELDMTRLGEFHRRVYQAARAIPPGQTCTYGELAKAVGDPGAARAVGQALGANPFAPVVPCHRILAASGHPGGFSATGGLRTKLQLLEIEQAQLGGQPGLF